MGPTQFVPLLLVLVLALVLSLLFLGLSNWLGPRRRTPLKETGYECGVPVRGSPQVRFFVRFFLVALLFLLFDLEGVLLYPWVVRFRHLLDSGQGLFALGELGFFLAILVVGYVYVWRKGGLEWQ